MLRLYVARHGQTDWNAKRRLQGATDIPLNEVGLLQARQLAESLSGLVFDQVYCSELQRSRPTALAVAPDESLIALADLNEQALGSFEGRELTDAGTLDSFRRRLRTAGDDLDGGESLAAHHDRVGRALAHIRAKHESGTVLTVGHGGTNAQLIRAAMKLGATDELTFWQKNGEVLLLELDGSAPARLWRAVSAADVSREMAPETP